MDNMGNVTPNMLMSQAMRKCRDETVGYQDGQRTVHLNKYLKGEGLRMVALHRIQEMSHLLLLNKRHYTRGFIQGYFDELNGLAHPLPEEERV